MAFCIIHYKYCLGLLSICPQQIRKLRRELESSQEKVADLTMQLSANVCMTVFCFFSKIPFWLLFGSYFIYVLDTCQIF